MGINSYTSSEEEPKWEIGVARSGDGAGIEEVRRLAWIETYPDPGVGLTLDDINSVPFGSHEKLARWEQSIESQGEEKHIWIAREDQRIVVAHVRQAADRPEGSDGVGPWWP